jgi:hypothetical protein
MIYKKDNFRKTFLKEELSNKRSSKRFVETVFDAYFESFFEELEKGNMIHNNKLGFFKKVFKRPHRHATPRDCIQWTPSWMFKLLFDSTRYQMLRAKPCKEDLKFYKRPKRRNKSDKKKRDPTKWSRKGKRILTPRV